MRRAWVEEKRREAEQLGNVAVQHLVPSGRDFFQFTATHKRGVAVIARLKRRDPFTGGAWPQIDLVATARAADDADVGAIAFRSAALFGASSEDLARGAAAVSAPILCDDLCFDVRLVYQARMCGANAVVIPAGELSAGGVFELVEIAASLHMAAVVESAGEDDLAKALRCPHAAVGLWCLAADGFVDLDAARALAAATPRQRLAVLLAEPRDLSEVAALSGLIDAAAIGDVALAAADPAAAYASAVEALR